MTKNKLHLRVLQRVSFELSGFKLIRFFFKVVNIIFVGVVYLFVRLKLSNQFKFDDPLFQMPMAFLEREREREREKI